MKKDAGSAIVYTGLMRILSALSTLTTAPAIAQDIEGQLNLAVGDTPDLLMVFVSYALLDAFESITALLRRSLRPKHLLAVVGESIIGNGVEVERSQAVSVLAMNAPGAILHSFHLAEDQWQEILTEDEFLNLQVAPPLDGDPDPPPIRAFFMFADPFTTPVVQLLDACSRRYPGAPVIGGMASGVQNKGDTRLALNNEVLTTGVVGISFSGDIEIDTLVSQGCRAVGETFVVTKGQQNVIEQLDGKPALLAIEEMVQGLPLLDRQLLVNGGLQVGRIIDQGKGSYGKGDFLIRSLMGVRRDTGAVLVGDMVHTGQTLQFHIRDARAADEELRLLLEGETMLSSEEHKAVGALLVTCSQRGTKLFEKPHHDVELTRRMLGDIPVAGFFAAGEMGPVGERNYVHGHTAALALFRQA
jgi:small ligand-binding sensory domain FIST